jgi:hypothetical protein
MGAESISGQHSGRSKFDLKRLPDVVDVLAEVDAIDAMKIAR